MSQHSAAKLARAEIRAARDTRTLERLAVPYPPEVGLALRGVLRRARAGVEAKAKRLVWSDERAAMARSQAAGMSGIRRPDGEERCTRGVVVGKDEGDGGGLVVAWVDTEYYSTKRGIGKRKVTVYGGTKHVTVTVGRAYEGPRRPGKAGKGDKAVALPGRGLLWVKPEEVISSADKVVTGALAGGQLEDRSFFEALRHLDRLNEAVTLLDASMHDAGLNPEIAQYLPPERVRSVGGTALKNAA